MEDLSELTRVFGQLLVSLVVTIATAGADYYLMLLQIDHIKVTALRVEI